MSRLMRCPSTSLAVFAAAMFLQEQSCDAAITVLQQTGQMTVHGQDGTFTAHAPSNQPWFQTVSSGGGGPVWFAQSFMFVNWSSTSMVVYAEAIVSPGSGSPVLTQSIADVSIRFSISQPTDVRILFDNAPDQAGPNVSLNTHSMRLLDHATDSPVVEGLVNNVVVALAPGQYRFEGHNAMGNLPGSLALSSGSRMLSMQLTIVPAPAGAGVLAVAMVFSCTRRRAARTFKSCGAVPPTL